ncbi:MAG: spermidine synthase [Myxococcaceae bacterium]|nr:spermidine synthase [Myxococcaceae bacterium]
MRIWKLLDRAEVPGNGGELRLYQLGGHFSIRADGTELMTSHTYDSEEALAALACQRLFDGQRMRKKVRLLVGGLGMGYTLAAALRRLRPDAEVVVAELVPAVVRWNRTHLGHLAQFPLDDPRVRVHEGDVAQLLRHARAEYDAILLDVDNGPEGLTRAANDWLYGAGGLHSAQLALREDGVLAVWSATPDHVFPKRLAAAGFEVEEFGPNTRKEQGGSRHTIWLGTPSEREPAARRERRQQHDDLG